jgi:hypothetical protein
VVTHKSRTGKTYYLHKGAKRGGGSQFYFSTKSTGDLADRVPDGFEVYETVNGQVFLRRQQPVLIKDEERDRIARGIAALRRKSRYKIEVRADVITIHESADRDPGWIAYLAPHLSAAALEASEERTAHYQAVLRFTLLDPSRRIFAPERYCFRGTEGWINIGVPDTLTKLAAKYLKHLGRDSIYELY